ncbi:MAG: AAA family ATPase [Oscillospiraceae bacterium]|nr:AAA family ATPase [Oscillospiraceae bacterium]
MMKYIGELVAHKTYGTGEIIACDEDAGTITIKYPYKEATVAFPVCFRNFLRFKNETLQEEMSRLLESLPAGSACIDEKTMAALKANTIVYGGFKGKSGKTENDIDIPIYTSYDQFIRHQERMLSEEINAVRFGRGGKKTRIQNGQLVEIRGQTFFYTFEGDTELLLPDDTDIQIWRENQPPVSAIAVHCEDFTVIIASKEYLGKMDISLEFSAEPWQLIQYLIDRLKPLQDYHSAILNDLIFHGMDEIDRNAAITKGQDNAVRMSSQQPITFIWGPPGTGKTETLARIAIQHMKMGYRVLMVSYSNVSVDGATWRVHNRSENQIPGRILRYGYPRDKELLDHEYLTSYRYILRSYPDLTKTQARLTEEKRTCSRRTPRYLEIEEQLRRIREKLAGEEKGAIRRTPFVATTIAKAIADKTLYEDKYDTVIFDEASMAYIPQVVFAASLAKKHFICMGDFNQLPPIVQQNDSCSLNADIFAYCGITDAVRMKAGHKWLCMLDIQHRMHPEISEYSSKHMYDGLLKSAEDIRSSRRNMALSEPYCGQPVMLMDLSGMMSVCMTSGENSRINVLSAFIAIAAAVRAAAKYDVGIITPYHSQSRLLHAIARSIGTRYPELHPIKCSTVHQFQGSEMPVIIFDAVDCYRQPYPGKLLNSKKNDYADRLFNVALTRAQGKFIAIANADYMREKDLPKDLLLREMIDALRNKADRGTEMLRNINSSIVSVGLDSEKTEQYLEDIRNAQDQICIDIPDSRYGFDENHFHSLCLELKEALLFQVELCVRAEKPEALPRPLADCATKSGKSCNPITIIDRRIIWFGYPCTKGNFELKDGTSVKTTTRPAIRYEGKEVATALINMLEMDHGKKIGYWDLHVPDYIPGRRKTAPDRKKATKVSEKRNTTPIRMELIRPTAPMPVKKNGPINMKYVVIVNRLIRKGLKYVDQTEKGGALYFFDKAMADELKKEGVTVAYAPNGTKSTKGKPAWYVKI